MSDNTKPISASNPPESKQPVTVQDAPVSPGVPLESDERVLDTEQEEKEEEVAKATDSKKKRTKVTDK